MSNTPIDSTIDTGVETDTAETPVVRISTFVSEHPLATAGAAIAAGAVIGLLLPRWRLAATAGTTVLRTAQQAVKAVAAAETARTVISGLSAASNSMKGSVKAGAHRLADHLPDADSVKASAKRAIEHATETAQKAGEKVATTARRTIKAGED